MVWVSGREWHEKNMKKKIVSLTLAAAMCTCMSASVFAATTTQVSTKTGSSTVTTEGDVNYLDTDIYEVTLPTDGCFNFTVDPQGILSATEPELYPEDTAGTIVAKSGGAFINNKSSVPIKLTVDAYVTDGGSTGSPAAINLMDLDKYDVVNSGIDNNMILTLGITGDNITTSAAISADTIVPDVIAVTHNGTTTDAAISFALQEAPYTFEKSGAAIEYKMDSLAAGDSVGMRLGGYVNTGADWKDFSTLGGAATNKVVVTTVFSFKKLATDYDSAALDGRAYATLGDAEAEYYNGATRDETTGKVTGAEAGDLEYDAAAGTLEVPFDFGTGINEVSVEKIAYDSNDIDEADYKVMNGVITFKSTGTVIANAIAGAKADGSTPAKDLVITTSDGYDCTIHLTIYGTAE